MMHQNAIVKCIKKLHDARANDLTKLPVHDQCVIEEPQQNDFYVYVIYLYHDLFYQLYFHIYKIYAIRYCTYNHLDSSQRSWRVGSWWLNYRP